MTAVSTTYILAVGGPQDAGIRDIAALSGRTAYALMCLTVCWGVLTATGWARRFGERKTLRSGHMVLATLTLAFGVVHAMSFMFLAQGAFDFAAISVPITAGGLFRHSMGIIGLELMLAIAITAGIYRWTSYKRWLWVHRMAYLALGLLALHSLFGALANGHLALLWLGGLTLLIPTMTLAILRFIPIKVLVGVGLVEEEA